MLRISLTESYDTAVDAAAIEHAGGDRHVVREVYRAAGAAYDRICEQPGLGRSLGGVMFSHSLIGFPFAVIYEVTDTEICFLYLAAV